MRAIKRFPGRRWAPLLAGLSLAAAGPTPAAPAAEEVSQAASPPEAAMARGGDALARGDFEEAVASLRQAADHYASSGQKGPQTQALLRLAEAQQAAGQYREAARTLQEALAPAESLGDPARLAAIEGALGNVQIALGPARAAERHLVRGVALARQAESTELAAAILNNLGNLYAFRGATDDALDAYAESAALAKQAGQPTLAARALANAARAALDQGDPARARKLADEAHGLAREFPPSHAKAYLLINLGRTAGRIAAGSAPRAHSHRLLSEALEVAQKIGDARATSYALGYIGELYEREQRYEESLQLAQRAIFQAEQVAAPESLYLWHWQIGRVRDAQGRKAEAIAAYQRAVAILQTLRGEMTVGYGTAGTSFREAVGPVYFGLVDVLLRASAEAPDPQREEALLVQARDTVEQLKAAELRDYFRDDCVDALQAKITAVEEVSPATAVVYPILLPDRLELLLGLPGGKTKRYTSAVGAEALTREIRSFRHLLEKRITREYLAPARQLYTWLIDPFARDLSQLEVDTLVFVPDGPLRTVPMSALHDGERHLIERYAVAVTPGVELTDPHPLDRTEMKPLLGGLSKSVAGYPELAHVAAELESVRGLLGGQVLLDDRFRLGDFEESLSDEELSVVHIATHGEFRGDVDQNFLLAYDGRLTMDRLQDYVGRFRFRDTPLELLTLSACETAVGDDRAALGLSGVAIKAGARSAIGTLWRVNDSAASQLVVAFYEQLHDESVSRAVALQRAQIMLMQDLRYWHPGYWSAFLLISSWL